ncbi:MAG: ABC transporter permease [Thermodesulfovibrionales bacterium]|jgi:ABC-type dipeptide/oligopeptide/nickel transport system permease subunit
MTTLPPARSAIFSIPLFIILLFVAAALFAPLLPLPDPTRIDLDSLREPPGLNHLLGTDHKGRDILSRIVFGGRISLGVAVVAAFISAGIGLVVGLVSGYLGGRVDMAVMALVDFMLSFPSLLLAIAISLILPPGPTTVMVAISAVGWTSVARVIRGHVLTVRGMPFVDAARAIGCSGFRVVFSHIAPTCIPLLVVMMGVKLGGYILTEATLSFLGLGVQPPMPSWGSMVSSGRAYILTAPWTVLFPGLAISITAFCFNMIGESVRKEWGGGGGRM